MDDQHIQDINLILDCDKTLKTTTQMERESEFDHAKYYFSTLEGFTYQFL